MSERERWVVYPLLFLALGAALRDKLLDSTMTKSIVCQKLTVVDEEPIGQQPVRILAQIGRDKSMRGMPAHGYMVVNGQLDTDLINAKQYAFRNVPFVPALQTIMSSPIDLLRALQQSMRIQQPTTNAAPPLSQPRADQAGPPADVSSAGEGQPQPAEVPNNPSAPATQAPLADPAENR